MSEQVTITFDATELDDFDLCNFRWHAIHNLNLRTRDTPDYFDRGSLFHTIMEKYYIQKRDHCLELESIIEFGRIESVEYDLPLDMVSKILFQVREYARYYEDETIVPVFIEKALIMLLHEDEDIRVYITGKPDLIFHYEGQTELFAMDHKTVFREFAYSPIRNQFLLYTTAIGANTFLLNKVGFQKTKKPKERFLRPVFHYPKEILEEWKQDVINSARRIAIATQFNHYPRNRTSCEKFNGCHFQRYCTTKPAGREFLIGTEYIVGESWDPTSSLEKKVVKKDV
jgi:hypothetical protein